MDSIGSRVRRSGITSLVNGRLAATLLRTGTYTRHRLRRADGRWRDGDSTDAAGNTARG
jgi:hypothetical protein